MYVPEALVPAFKKALENGRRLESFLYESGARALKDYRRQRDAKLRKGTPGKTTPERKRRPSKAKTRSKPSA
jgi:hypothetical protein